MSAGPKSPPAARPVPVVESGPEEAAREVAGEIAERIRARAQDGAECVLGLPTGSSPLKVYAELARLRAQEGLSFENVRVFNLDEWLGLPADHPQLFARFMREQLAEPTGLSPRRFHVPAATLDESAVAAHCREYERRIVAAGGIDVLLLGLGRNGHIAFNEPGSRRDTRTRRVALEDSTREDAAQAFGGLEQVPKEALSVGVATILAARSIRMLAFGERKRQAVRRMLEGPVGPDCPATFLRGHADVRLYADASALQR